MSPPQQHARNTTANTRRAAPTHARPLRPPPLGPRKHSHSAQSKKTTATSAKSHPKRDIDPEDEDMAGLPQFCATCEKQILTPACNSILYCSESCRRKDHNKPLSHSILPSEPSPQPITPRSSYFFEDNQHEILPMRSPTVVRPPSLAFSDDSSDLSGSEEQPAYRRSESDGYRYLSHYRYSSTDQSPRRASYEPYTPSLSHTPTSLLSTVGSYLSARPLPGRKNPYSASFSSLSVDLVTPVVNTEPLTASTDLSHQSTSLRSSVSTSTAFRVVEGEMSYEKKDYASGTSPSKGSLRQLFFHEAMQAPPRHD
ncbi:hypothetical protein E4T42_07372 [Aureobasidium subglaciale]|uniref:Uncharacterized protein n=1 Tax=Aureobasidium subglaciale (strain EXF-2481) TaxID=1043005 RepID=A0A074ZED6_AURSE|nr:uncharacterized protein AUEXF2481DRAFT_28124 [Aureobasidium subglaciale EXF-2481]KAI5195428.1 hypothetical protein E4T38_09074 [Aureobasidium subglaciale]KAI5217133.1 hypothetical protein E4T41_08976 [Aureobasidium subglaciale]KAI5223287.1 hypothetical protein E4T40_04568 [Aureobasidium subglaciale]KAI5243361.1 hypothetical protein E4T42_07372 [Aureobasidium subglaciale]KAI5254924.1 hypothetical protein E4T46_09010 [Aureobasidium subglaciale]